MRKIRYQLLLCGLLCTLIGTSCSKEVTGEMAYKPRQLRHEIVKTNPSRAKQKAVYDTLDVSTKKSLWVDKLDYVLEKGIPSQSVAKIVKDLKQLLESTKNLDDLKDSQEFRFIAEAAAKEMSKKDFRDMFMSLKDMNPALISTEIKDTEWTTQLSYEFERKDIESPQAKRTRSSDRKDCNCNWTCGDFPSKCTHSNCNVTSHGCGFLWLFSCRQKDELFPNDCP